MDFTIANYLSLINVFKSHGFAFQTFAEFLANPKNKAIVLRHDVDLLPLNSLRFAKIQAELGVRGTYYFRAVPESWDELIIKQISILGHEIGYHYESLTTCNGNFENAFEDFSNNLARLRELAPVNTICMHGSPRSKWDSKDLWKHYDYKQLGIIGEPYFDINYDEVFYLTDTGRRWDGWKYSLRDKVEQQDKWIKQGLVFKNTDDVINALNNKIFPLKAMITFHPQRWNNIGLYYFYELISQSFKNQIKKQMISAQNK
jgi:hypothetical protein